MDTLKTLPRDEVRQIMWRYSDRFDFQMLVQSTRSVARGPVARLVAEGGRNSHEWTEQKNELLKHFDEAGITAASADTRFGGYLEGPKNFILALVAFELSWVDGGSATCSLANNLALAPIVERGTEEQRAYYVGGSVPGMAPNGKGTLRGAFALTEPIPYVGVDTGVMCGKISVAEWEEGQEPVLRVDKRARFITNMAFANYATVAVDAGDDRIASSCMVIIEEDDEGTWDRGVPTQKMVHQLSSTRDPIFSVKVPASRIIGGYTIKDGKVVPNYSQSEVIEAVFRRTRVTVGLMTAAKLLSAIEPIIRYQRGRFKGGEHGAPGTPRYDMGIQQKEDALHRLVDIWATGEAAASMGFESTRILDEFDMVEQRKLEIFAEKGIKGGRQELRELRRISKDALEFIKLGAQPEAERDSAKYEALRKNELVQYVILDCLTNVLCPATKLWDTGHGANTMRDAVSLMGGYGITEDCPGFLGHKWMDAQLEATYEGPEAVQRRQLSMTMTNDVFLAIFRNWMQDMLDIAAKEPGSGACAVASAMKMWLWTLEHLQSARDANGSALYHSKRQGVTFPMADALCWAISVHFLIKDVMELKEKGAGNPMLAEGFEGLMSFYKDLCFVQSARAAGEISRVCADLVFGYMSHPDSPAEEAHCASLKGLEDFVELRSALCGHLTGARLAKDRAAEACTQVMIPEALDYPL